ncbi:MAG TPA: hypothetical protein VFN22_13415 [Gemmatimonadales bacterium]|nr:hypothetical protein [Gemmatimonadales bacterium]
MTDSPLSPASLQAAVASLGYELVDVTQKGPASAPEISLRIDRPGGAAPGHGVTTEDCARVSRSIEASLEASGAVGARWRLDVSSPGIERPVRFPEHWRRYIGQQVLVRARGITGRQVARILAVSDEDELELDVNGTRHRVPREAVRDATLVVDWSNIG